MNPNNEFPYFDMMKNMTTEELIEYNTRHLKNNTNDEWVKSYQDKIAKIQCKAVR